MNEENLNEIKNFIDDNFKKGLTIKEIAEKYKIDERDLRDQFYGIFGKSPKKYIEDLRAVIFIQLAVDHKDNERGAAYYRVELGYKHEHELHNFLKRRTDKKYLEVINIIKNSKNKDVSILFKSLFKS